MERSEASTPIPPALAGTPQIDPPGAPNPHASQAPQKAKVAIPDVTVADDSALVSRITALVNAVYTTTEEGLFAPAYRRTDDDEVRQILRAGELALAWLVSHSQSVPAADTVIGCIRFFGLSPTTGDFGVLACDPAYRGAGTGRKLVHFAEEQCRTRGMTIMQCELLVSKEFDHPFKVRLQAWYERMGYRVVRSVDFGQDHPHLALHLITKAELRVFEKSLVR